MFILAFVIATLIPLAALYLIRRHELYGTSTFKTVLACFAWGLIAFALAYLANTATMRAGLVTVNTFRRFTAPIIEEILKALVLVYLVRRPQFTYPVDGAIYGFAAGIGFAIVENYSYILGNPAAAIMVAISRVISTNLMHATGSAVIGIALGEARLSRPPRSVLFILGGLALALAVHIGFNNLVTRVSSGLLLLYAAAVGLAGAGFIVVVIRRQFAAGQRWINEALGDADRVSAHETAVVTQAQAWGKLLAPVKECFPDKVTHVERFLRLQGQLGIKRKTLDMITDEKLIRDLQAEMETIRRQMDEARRAAGTYAMLYVRNIIPPEATMRWSSVLDERIAATASAAASAEDPAAARAAGAGLWSNLGERTAAKPSASTPDEDE
jgi:RsiW-degrading membrane proteinase PrsW (M82 family)